MMNATAAATGSSGKVWNNFDLFHWRALFYVVGPHDFDGIEKLEDVPDYANEVIPVFFFLILMELLVKIATTGSGFRLNDSIASASAGMVAQVMKLALKGFDVALYVWLFTNFRFFTFPLQTWTSWILAFVLTDLGYYAFHRASHEINVLWGAHQVHHSSEEYNFGTALRQSAVSHTFAWIFYLPMAFVGFTPAAYVVHQQLNILYQFWIHTSMIKSLGPLEWFMNTPSHHRVHHGRNPYCIDKNYGGTLIIWDRLLGTFAAEDPEEKVVFGIIHSLGSFNALWVQLHHFTWIGTRLREFKTLPHRISAVFKGPGWNPGTPWRGIEADLPPVENPVQYYDPKIPGWRKLYAFIHYCAVVLPFVQMMLSYETWPSLSIWMTSAYIVLSLANIGSIFDDRPWIMYGEIARCIFFAAYCPHIPGWDNTTFTTALQVLFFGSVATWMPQLLGYNATKKNQ